MPPNFPAPANSRDLRVVVHTAVRDRNPLIGDTGDTIILRTGPQSINKYLRNVRAYARDDGSLEIRFAIEPDSDDTMTWPPQVPAQVLVRLFDKNGQYLNHFTTRESFAPTPYVQAHLNRDPIAMVNPSPALLLDVEGNSNVLVYPVNARDLAFTKAVEVGFFLRPVRQSELQAIPPSQRHLPPSERRYFDSEDYACRDYLKCFAPKSGLRSPVPTATPPPTRSNTPAKDLFADAETCTVGRWSFSLRSIGAFGILFGPAAAKDRKTLDPAKVDEFKATTPICRVRSGEEVLVATVRGGQAFAIKRVADPTCKGITLTDRGLDCP